MKRILCLLVLTMTCFCLFAGMSSASVYAADNDMINHAGYYNGSAYGVGIWDLRNDRIKSITADSAVLPEKLVNTLGGDEEYVVALEHLSSGEGTWHNQTVLTWQTNSPITNFLSGEFESIIELHPTQTVYPTTVKFRMANANSGTTTADFIGLDVISLGGIDADEENMGKIMVGNNHSGLYYKANETYTFKVIADTTNDTYSVYLLQGPVSASADGEFNEASEETLLGSVSDINNNNWGFVRTIDFMITGLPTDEDKGIITYFKNIEFNMLPLRAYLKSDVNIGDTDIPLAVSNWVAAKASKSTALSGTILVKKNGIPLEYETDYTVTASYCSRSTLNSWSRNPVIALTQPIAGGDTFEIDFNDVTDIQSRKTEGKNVKFTVSAQPDDKLGLALESLDDYILNGNSGFDNITTDLDLIGDIDGVEIKWTSSDTDVIGINGAVTPPASFDDCKVELMAELLYEGKTYKKAFECTVKTTYDPSLLQNALDALTETLILGENSGLTQITQNMNLPSVMDGNITVLWSSSNKKAIDTDGTVTRPTEYLDYQVLLTAKLTDGIGTFIKTFSCTVKTTFDPNRPPMVTDISVSGIERADNTLTISYKFDDVNGFANKSQIQWEYSEDNITFIPIKKATSESYVIDKAYVGKYLRVAIQPVNSEGKTGDTVYSEVIGPVMAKSSAGSSGGGSGGSGGSGSSSRPSSGGSGLVSFTPPAISGKEESNNDLYTSDENYSFLDVTQDHWAAESVNKLVSAGVISQDSSRKFRPDDSITREEFMKMVVTALKIEGGSGSFLDMDKSYWAYKYAAAALQAGIATGYEDGTFRGTQPITRQEMAVMLNRAADYCGIDKNIGKTKEFTDMKDISDFAVESVNKMSAAGIISGMPDGRFLPAANATRAEAAKMIYGVYANVQK